MVERIKNSSKPILLVEDRYTELYKVAWMKLHIVSFDEDTFQSVFDRESPFDIVSANGSQNLYFFLNMAHIPFEIEDRKVVGLFDFDDAFNSFQGLDSNEWGEIIGSDSDGWYRKRKSTRNYSAMVLPVPGFRSDLASRNYGGNSLLEIELYFKNETLGKDHYGVDTSRPGNLSRFLGKKKSFWKKTLSYKKEEFSEFAKLFSKVEELLAV